MASALEAQFINRFVAKNRRERMIFELSSPKRDHGFFRLTFDAETLIPAKYMHPYKFTTVDQLYADMLGLDCSPECAYILCNPHDENSPMPLYDALALCKRKYGGTFFVVAQGAIAAYYESEPNFATKKYLIY